MSSLIARAINPGFRIASLLLFAACASPMVGCSDSQQAAAGGGPAGEERLPLIRVAVVEQQMVSPQITVVGSVIPTRTSIVASGASGLVEEFHVEEGDFVKEGQTLSALRMLSTDLGIAEAKAVLREREDELRKLQQGSRPEEIAEALAKLKAAEALELSTNSKLKRTQLLFERNAVNQDEMDVAAERAEAAKQAVLALKSAYELVEAGPREEDIAQAEARRDAQKEQVAYLEAEKDKRITLAPFNGYIVKEQTFVGEWLSQGDPIITLAYLDEVDVVVNVDQRELEHIRLGESASIKVLTGNRTEWTGRVSSIVPRSDWETGSRGFPVKVRLDNEFVEHEGQTLPVLKEGMMAEVTFLGEPTEAVLIPKDALVRSTRGSSIFVFESEEAAPGTGVVNQLPITTGISHESSIQAIHPDLKPEMLVVVEGAERLRPFQKVQLMPAASDAEQSAAGGETPGPDSPGGGEN